jgi:hypothetical protein
MTSQPEICHLCHERSESVHNRYGVPICGSCKTLFWFAEVLLEADVTEEEIVPTLAFARHAELLWPIRDPEKRVAAAHKLVARYPAFALVEVVSGVPVLRMKHALLEAVRYPGSDLARSIRIRLLNRFADPDDIARRYWDVCERENLPRHKSSRGSLTWYFDRMHLVVDVGPREEIHSARLPGLSDYPQVRRFAFPLDAVVRDLLRALLGHGQEKNLMFGALLSDLGRSTRMSRATVVMACVLWQLLGERTPNRVPREEEAAEVINRLLLEPLEMKPLTISRNDATWRNAKELSSRLDLCSYLLQEITDGDNPFQKRLSTAP